MAQRSPASVLRDLVAEIELFDRLRTGRTSLRGVGETLRWHMGCSAGRRLAPSQLPEPRRLSRQRLGHPGPLKPEVRAGMFCVWAARTARRRTSNRARLLTPRRGSVLEREWAGTLITSPSLLRRVVRPADRTPITRSFGPWPLSPCSRAMEGATLIFRSSSQVTVPFRHHPECTGA